METYKPSKSNTFPVSMWGLYLLMRDFASTVKLQQLIKGRSCEWKYARRAPLHPDTELKILQGLLLQEEALQTCARAVLCLRFSLKWKIFYVFWASACIALTHANNQNLDSFLHSLDMSIDLCTKTLIKKILFKFGSSGHWFSVSF